MTSGSAGIVVGVDGSAAGRVALDWALRAGLTHGCPVGVLHCWHPQLTAGVPVTSVQLLRNGSERMIRHEVDVVSATFTTMPDLTLASAHGRPVPTLVTASERARILVLGAHTRGGDERSLSGDVTQGCLRHARCPVVVVGPTGLLLHDPTTVVTHRPTPTF